MLWLRHDRSDNDIVECYFKQDFVGSHTKTTPAALNSKPIIARSSPPMLDIAGVQCGMRHAMPLPLAALFQHPQPA